MLKFRGDFGTLMKGLKPKLILTKSGRKRRGSGSFFMLLIVFAVGFYVGTKYDDYYPGSDSSDVGSQVKGADGANDDGANIGDVPGQENIAPLFSDESVNTGNEETSIDGKFLGDRMLGSGDTSESTDLHETGASSPEKNGFEGDNAAQTSKDENNSLSEEDSETTSYVREEADAPEKDIAYAYTLQVAAFSAPEEAQTLADEYRNKGYNAYIIPVENSRGEKWNLVKIGRFKTIEQAWDYSADFKRREGQDVYVESLGQSTVFNESWDQQNSSDR